MKTVRPTLETTAKKKFTFDNFRRAPIFPPDNIRAFTFCHMTTQKIMVFLCRQIRAKPKRQKNNEITITHNSDIVFFTHNCGRNGVLENISGGKRRTDLQLSRCILVEEEYHFEEFFETRD